MYRSQESNKLFNNQESEKETIVEDSVLQDISRFKRIFKNIFSRVELLPFAKCKLFFKLFLSALLGNLEKFSEVIKTNIKTKRILKIIAILIVIFLFFLTIFNLFRRFGLVGNKEKKVVYELTPTPTPISFFYYYKPSVYAKDPEVLKFEEDAKVLQSEFINEDLREAEFFPPDLDFNISF